MTELVVPGHKSLESHVTTPTATVLTLRRQQQITPESGYKLVDSLA